MQHTCAWRHVLAPHEIGRPLCGRYERKMSVFARSIGLGETLKSLLAESSLELQPANNSTTLNAMVARMRGRYHVRDAFGGPGRLAARRLRGRRDSREHVARSGEHAVV